MTDLTTLSNEDLEREIERLCEEQERRRVLALRAIRNQHAFLLPARLYAEQWGVG